MYFGLITPIVKKTLSLLPGLVLFCIVCFCQPKRSLPGTSWITREVYALPANTQLDDTAYTRFSFLKSNAYISFTPAWNGRPFNWSMSGSQLTIGYVQYTVEEWNDSTLIIFEPGGRRYILDNEAWLNRHCPVPTVVGEAFGQPLYAANKIVTPRYKKADLRNVLQHDMDGYNIRKAITFEATFIVKVDGSVDSVRIVHSIIQGFDYEVTERIRKTSKDWTPALYQGKPVQTRMVYTIKYLDSIVPPGS